MAATMTAGMSGGVVEEGLVWPRPATGPVVRPALRLVGPEEFVAYPVDRVDEADVVEPAPGRRTGAVRPHRVSPAVRRRRALLALLAVVTVALMFPLGGVGGRSHATGPAAAAPVPGHAYVVRAGDTLWSIASAADPNGDPRPVVAEMAAQLGGDSVVPGERVVVP